MKELLTTAEAGEYLGLAEKTLENFRSERLDGPPFVKLGCAASSPVRYRLADLRKWVAARVVKDGRHV